MVTLTKFNTKTAINTDHLVNLFNTFYPYQGIDRLVYRTTNYVIVVILYSSYETIDSGIYTTFDIDTPIDNVTEWDYESVLSKSYLIDAIEYCENDR